MSPRVEKFINPENPTLETKETKCFVIELNTTEELNIELFDKLASSIGSRMPYALDVYLGIGKVEHYELKWIVRGNRMFFFPHTMEHRLANHALEMAGFKDKLQSAGDYYFHSGRTSIMDMEEKYVRRLHGHSETSRDVLPLEQSEHYKNTVLKEKLGPYFEIQ